MKYFLLLFVFAAGNAIAQPYNKAQKQNLAGIKQAVYYLSADKLEGRRTGTPGEKMAYSYMAKQFKKAGLVPYGDNGSYLQQFEVNAKENRLGTNVVGFIDNKAPLTIVLGAHLDHLGYGEDKNSMYTGAEKMIHNGADDNASGSAMLLHLAKWLKGSDLKKYNYLIVSFSGEELGLFGSKYFTDHSPVAMTNVNYMINMDMVGRLSDSTKAITVGGYGTSPAWGSLIKEDNPGLRIKFDSSGTGPSDHTSFYRKDVPVLFFFTGTHKDYHRPTDDADKINYEGMVSVFSYIQNLLIQTNEMDKLVFTKTREVSMARSSFKVTMGVMLDYTFAGPGIYVDGISSDRPAEKAGVKPGDIIMKIGEDEIADVEGYMKVLGKHEKGQTVEVKVKRGEKEIMLPLTF
jgi:aminopeptidase YwaD